MCKCVITLTVESKSHSDYVHVRIVFSDAYVYLCVLLV